MIYILESDIRHLQLYILIVTRPRANAYLFPLFSTQFTGKIITYSQARHQSAYPERPSSRPQVASVDAAP